MTKTKRSQISEQSIRLLLTFAVARECSVGLRALILPSFRCQLSRLPFRFIAPPQTIQK